MIDQFLLATAFALLITFVFLIIDAICKNNKKDE